MNKRIVITVVIKRAERSCSEHLLEAFVSEDEANRFIDNIQSQEDVKPNSFYKIKIPLNLLNSHDSRDTNF